MKIFRHKKSGKLYYMYFCRPPKIMGCHYEAHPYKHDGKLYKRAKTKDFEPVATSSRVPLVLLGELG